MGAEIAERTGRCAMKQAIRLIALMCVALVIAGAARSTHAMAEAYLHANAVSHVDGAVIDEGVERNARSGVDHAHDRDNESNQDQTPNQPGDHHHQADHHVDSASLSSDAKDIPPRPNGSVVAWTNHGQLRGTPDSIERPPRLISKRDANSGLKEIRDGQL